MLFLLSDEGEPSEGIYVRVGPDDDQEYVCEASELLAILERACTAEPHTGLCDPADEVATELDVPMVALGAGGVPGFRVLVPAGTVEDHLNPTTDELAALEGLCAAACEQHIAGRPATSANCGDAGAFAAIELAAEHGERPLELVRADHLHGEDLFPPARLACDLASECHTAFDEDLASVGPGRVTPARDAIDVGVEWTLAIVGAMEAMSSHAVGTTSAAITGRIAYSLCNGGNATEPCPFYLGGLELELDDPLSLALVCDGETATHTLSSLSLSLAQPAFGMAEEGTPWRAFPPGALVFEAEGVLDDVPFGSRRPNQEPLYLRATDGWSMVQGIDGAWLQFGVPCGEEVADVWVWWGYSSVDIEGEPPYAEITVPATVPCPSTVTLTASLSDDDGDFAHKQWFVDGVRIEHDTTELEFTEGHELRLVARDSRGATTTDVETVSCQ